MIPCVPRLHVRCTASLIDVVLSLQLARSPEHFLQLSGTSTSRANMVMSTSAQCLPRQGLSLCTVLRPAAATALHAYATRAEAFSEVTDKGSPDDTITIIIAIVGALLTLVSVIVALLQYRLQVQRSRDEERGGDVIAMEPQPPARLARPT